MGSSAYLVEDLHDDLDEINGVINILELASQELMKIIACDEAVRKNPLRQRQLSSIAEQLATARVRQSSVARMIEQLEVRSWNRPGRGVSNFRKSNSAAIWCNEPKGHPSGRTRRLKALIEGRAQSSCASSQRSGERQRRERKSSRS